MSNVINGRGNVSVEKIRLVMGVAQRMGYKVNAKAKSLRQGKDRAVAVLLPGIEFERFAAVYECIQREFSAHGYTVQLYSTRSMEIIEHKMLTEALNARVAAIITSTCLPDADACYGKEAGELPLVFLQSDGPRREGVMYAGFDPETAGRDIADYLHSRDFKRVGVFTDSAQRADTALFLRGFREAFPAAKGDVRYLDCPNHQIDLRAFELFESDASYDCVVCTDRRREAAVRAACAYASSRETPLFVTVCTRMAVTEPDAPAYELDDKRLAHGVVKALLACLENGRPLPARLKLPNDAFRALPAPFVARPRALRLLTVASPASAALERLKPYLEKSTGIRLETTVLPLRGEYDALQTSDRRKFDLIRMDVAWLDELGQRVYRPLDGIDYDWDGLQARFIRELGDNYTRVDGVRCCLPYDPSTQLLFYRQDLFSDPTNKRMYFETLREALDVPRDFEAYNRVARFFTRDNNPASPIRYGSAVSVGNVVVSPGEFLPRLYEEGGDLLDETGRIELRTPQAVRALISYRTACAYSGQTARDSWRDVLAGFADGSAAMTVVFINYASHILNLKLSRIAGTLGFAPVPGGNPLLGGGVIGITPDCACPQAACDFLAWLTSDLVAPVFTLLGGLSPCQSAYGNRDILEKYPWLNEARKSFPLARRRRGSALYQNFSELQLENILALHLRRAVLGDCAPQDALRDAQRDCETRFIPKF